MRGCLLVAASLAVALAAGAPAGATVEVDPSLDAALERLYNFDFEDAHARLDTYIAGAPEDPMGYLFRAGAFVFEELDRLKILESEFFKDDKRIAAGQNLAPDPDIRDRLMEALGRTESLALERLEREPDDTDALFALCLREGLLTDYHGLVEKRKLKGLKSARQAQRFAERLLAIDPTYYDAHLAGGVNEYLLGRLPFFLRWFVRIEGVQGTTDRALERLELVADKGSYLAPFARILMSIIALREQRGYEAQMLLAGLRAEFPENPLIRKELLKVSEKLASGELATGE